MHPIRIILNALLLSFAIASAAPPIGDPAKSGLDPARLALIPERLKEYVDRNEIAGAVALVSRHGVTASLDAVGYADIDKQKPMRADSIFQVMSMTKPFCATAILMLVEEGRLALMDPVEKYIPEFRGQMMVASQEGGTITLKKPSRAITLRDLLTHTSGMAPPPPGLNGLYQQLDKTLGEAVAIYAQQPLQFEPGSQWRYSNTGIATLGRLVEIASGMPFEKFLATRIFEPLGMKDSFLFPPADKIDRIAIVHSPSKDGKGRMVTAPGTILGGDPRNYRKGAKYSAPEFGLHSTATDLAAFYNMLRAGGVHNGKRLLSKAAIQAMTALQTGDLKAGHLPGTGFGLAWEVTKEPLGILSMMSVGSYGHGGAFGTHGWIDPAKDMVGVFLIQLAGGATNAKAVFMAMAGSAVVD